MCSGARTRHINRIKGLLAGQGVSVSILRDFPAYLETIRLWDGSPLPMGLRARIAREFERMQVVNAQIKYLEAERRELVRHSQRSAVEMVRQLMRMQGIGIGSAGQWVMAFCAWREFQNRRQVGALSGLTPTPYQSGEDSREQGISKEGNVYVRGIAIQIAWGWLRYQPESKLTRWYEPRFGQGSKRLRKIGIVALARKLLLDCWIYLETGLVPEGVELHQWQL